MPGAQVLDLNPNPRTELTPLEITLGGFSKRNRENQLEQEETDALKEIYSQYQSDGKNLEKAIMDIQTRPGISPTSRVNTINQLLQFQKHNLELQEKAEKKDERAEKKTANQTILADIEQRRGLAPGSLNAYADDPKMAEQVTRPKKETQASQPISPDQLRRIQHVENMPEFAKASLPEKSKMLRDAGVSKENYDSVLKPFTEEAKAELGKFEKDRAVAEKRNAPYVKTIESKRKNKALRQNSLNEMEQAIISGEVKSFQNYVADVTGFEPWRTTEGARFKTASKEYFLNNVQKTGARPNQWIEQQILASQAQFGRSDEANLTWIAHQRFEDELDNKEVEIFDELEEEYLEKQGYVPSNISAEVNKRLKPFTEQRQKELALEIRKIHENAIGYEEMGKLKKVPEGTPLTLAMAKVLIDKYPNKTDAEIEDLAKKMGFTIDENQ